MKNKKLKKMAAKICDNMEPLKNLTDKELRDKTEEFCVRLKNGESINKILPEAYAVVGEASYRTTGLRPYPVQFMGAIALHHGKVVEQRTGEGKAVTLDTRIPTPSGWRTAGEIKVGDFLFGRDGKPTKVIGVYPQGKKKVYQVIFGDGRRVATADEHLWSVFCNDKDDKLTTINTKELLDRTKKGETIYIPMNEAVQYQETANLNDPYKFGMYLGMISIGAEMETYIPEVYRIASINQRRDLIRGILEINAETYKTYTYFTSHSSRYRDDLMEVLCSLGIPCHFVHDDPIYRIIVNTSDLDMLMSEQDSDKIKRPLPSKRQQRVSVYIVVETNREEEMVCFTVDNSEHLFLCGNYIVTHNTLVAAMPAYLNALEGNGVHVVTVNDYLAARDAKDIGRIHEFLGLSVGCVLRSTSPIEKKKEYAKDITYITNTELGFDYLRDNMAKSAEERVQRGFNYCIIDEVDSVLIDEARTPLIIAGEGEKSKNIYIACNELAKILEKGEAGNLTKVDMIAGVYPEETGDYTVDEEHQNVTLTIQGIKRCEDYFGITNLADREHTEMMHNIIAALKAHNLMSKDKDYVVKNGEIILVDAFTGRLQPGRRYTDGLHQAIEAKEGVQIRNETTTFATVTYQNFFNKYNKKCGMTGTACTEKKEFKEIYHMDVVKIPTNRPEIRKDLHDQMFLDRQSKFEAVIEKVKLAYAKGQPVLIGTSTIQDSEILDSMMTEERLPHTVLNAKYLEKEAKIISEAGKFQAITIATNMAGRGTDIKLEDKSKEVGGLLVIGTQRHESRRIDNQLKGRAGRQGDPGESIFMISLDDEILRLYGQDRMKNILKATGLKTGERMENRTVDRFVKKSQKVIEENNYGTRKKVLKFDRVNNEQRELIYADRNAILNKADTRNTLRGMICDVINMTVDQFCPSRYIIDDEYEACCRKINMLINGIKIPGYEAGMTKKVLAKKCIEAAEAKYYKLEREWGNEAMFREFERQVLLRCLDIRWMQHINDLEILMQNISLVGYGQKDPAIVYKLKAYDMFQSMIDEIKKDTVHDLFSSRLKVGAA